MQTNEMRKDTLSIENGIIWNSYPFSGNVKNTFILPLELGAPPVLVQCFVGFLSHSLYTLHVDVDSSKGKIA